MTNNRRAERVTAGFNGDDVFFLFVRFLFAIFRL